MKLNRYALAFLAIFLFCELADAQSFYRRNRKTAYMVSLGVGTSSYEGDLVNPQLNIDFTGAAYAGFEANIQGRLNVRGDLTWYRLSAPSDKTIDSEDKFFVRNLSFTSNNLEFSGMLVFDVFQYDPRNVVPLASYVLAGVGGTYYNPKAELNGADIELRPLMTEGVEYGNIALVIPVGGGIRYRIDHQWSVGLEAIYRFTNTDYLDDVSSVYVDNNSFSDPIARQLADRRPEEGLPVRPAGFKRGESEDNDGYFIIGLKANYHFDKGLYYRRKRNKRSKIFRRR